MHGNESRKADNRRRLGGILARDSQSHECLFGVEDPRAHCHVQFTCHPEVRVQYFHRDMERVGCGKSKLVHGAPRHVRQLIITTYASSSSLLHPAPLVIVSPTVDARAGAVIVTDSGMMSTGHGRQMTAPLAGTIAHIQFGSWEKRWDNE